MIEIEAIRKECRKLPPRQGLDYALEVLAQISGQQEHPHAIDQLGRWIGLRRAIMLTLWRRRGGITLARLVDAINAGRVGKLATRNCVKVTICRMRPALAEKGWTIVHGYEGYQLVRKNSPSAVDPVAPTSPGSRAGGF